MGSTARAMMNMGLRRLTVVDPAPSFDPERARWMAPGAGEVLEQMRIVPTLDEALRGVHRVVAYMFRHHGPVGVLARTWPTGSMALWVALLLGGFLLLYYS